MDKLTSVCTCFFLLGEFEAYAVSTHKVRGKYDLNAVTFVGSRVGFTGKAEADEVFKFVPHLLSRHPDALESSTISTNAYSQRIRFGQQFARRL